MSSPDVAIIGGGAIGAAVAYELSRSGAQVLVLERSTGAQGCSRGSAGLISPSHSETLASGTSIRHGIAWMGRRDSPFHVRPRVSVIPWMARFLAASLPERSASASRTLRSLTAASLERHEALARSGMPTSFKRQGILSVYESERTFERASRRIGDTNGAAAHALGPEAARELLPGLSPRIGGAIYHPEEAHCDPSRFVDALLDAAHDLGTEIRSGVETLRLRRVENSVSKLETTTGEISAETVVLAAGVWTRNLATDIGVKLPLEAAKGYHLEIERDPSQSSVPAFLEDAHVTATPFQGRLRLTGTLDLSGLDLRVDPIRLRAIEDAAHRTLNLPAVVRPSGVWRGLRPCAPDGMPIIGRAAEVDNLLIATGHAMLGIALAPITGEIISDLVLARRPRHPAEPFAPSRFRHGRQLLQNPIHHARERP